MGENKGDVVYVLIIWFQHGTSVPAPLSMAARNPAMLLLAMA